MPTMKVGGTAADDFSSWIEGFEPKAQERTTAQDDADQKTRDAKTALLKMKILGIKVAQIIDGHFSDDAGMRDDLDDVFRIVPRSEPTILARARTLYPVWVRANAALAARTPPEDPITRKLQGTPQTAAMLKALLDGFTENVQQSDDAGSLLNKKRSELRALDRKVDRKAKDWYQVVKNTYDPGSPEYDALSQIPTEGGTPAPDAIDLQPLEQGGDDGLHVLVSYEPGGGDHATEKKVEYMVEGVDADFGHAVDVDPSGNTLGPFTVGQVVRVRTKASNSSGSRTSAPRSITIEEPL
jgi:hypothetical protein